MDHIWKQLFEAAQSVQNERVISRWIEAGGVGAAVLSAGGNIYTGVCIDTACSLGMCAERNAIAHMLTCGEDKITKVVALMPDGKPGMPCGACRELMMQLDCDSENIEILVDYPDIKVKRLGELMPDWWG